MEIGNRPLKIIVLGTCGFPNVQGGVEAHCENLYPRLAGLGCDVTVITRRPYVDPGVTSHKGARLVPLDCPRNKFLEAIVLLEAMSYGLSRVVSDIPANREVRLGENRYFGPGDIEGLSVKLREFIARPMSEEERSQQVKHIEQNYDWGTIAEETLEVYRGVSAGWK